MVQTVLTRQLGVHPALPHPCKGFSVLLPTTVCHLLSKTLWTQLPRHCFLDLIPLPTPHPAPAPSFPGHLSPTLRCSSSTAKAL